MPPNVVVVICDDLGYGDVGCYGAEYDTPNIDRLAESGVRFTDWHSNAPVCSPSRASLLTGRYPRRAGVPGNVAYGRGEHSPGVAGLPPEETTMADVLGEAGYDTGAVGKWHLGMVEEDGPLNHGFDSFYGFRSGCVDYYSHTFMWGQHDGVPPYHDLFEDGEEIWENGEYLTERITERSVEFVADHADDEDPFFLYTAYNAPHYPMHAPEEYFDRFPDLSGERLVQAAMVAGIDDGVGAILDELEAQGVREDTVVVFTSDHGPSREVRNHLDGSMEPYEGGSTGGHRGHKFSLFEGGIRLPGVVSYPAELSPGECEELALNMDVLPTVCELCGVDAPDGLDGESVTHLLAGEGETPHEAVYWEQGDQLAARRGDWKLVLEGASAEVDPEEPADPVHLSHLGEDPGETENLAEERPEIAEELAEAARAWRAEVEG